MATFMHLWLPIILSAAAVWFFSAMAWMMLPHHKDEFTGLPDEDSVMNYIRTLGLAPGKYGFPHCAGHAAAKDPKFIEKWKTGPAGSLHIWPQISMGKNMVLSFVTYLVASILIAYLGAVAIAPGASFAHVFRVLGTAGVLTYTIAALPGAIWFCASRSSIIAGLFDGVVQGLITGAIFAALWPHA